MQRPSLYLQKCIEQLISFSIKKKKKSAKKPRIYEVFARMKELGEFLKSGVAVTETV